jgi:RNA polymerase sigma-70 factor (ECF subfamily)
MQPSSFDEQSDSELVEASLRDPQAFGVLVRRYQQKLRRYIRRLTNIPEEDIEDILQEIFIKVYYNLNGFDPSLKFSSWIYRIAHNQVISSFRKRSVRPQGNSVSIDDDNVWQFASELDVQKEIELASLRDHIFQVFDEMDLKYREVLVLRYFEEKDYQEISDILKKPKGTVSTLINRAKKQFVNKARKLGLE